LFIKRLAGKALAFITMMDSLILKKHRHTYVEKLYNKYSPLTNLISFDGVKTRYICFPWNMKEGARKSNTTVIDTTKLTAVPYII